MQTEKMTLKDFKGLDLKPRGVIKRGYTKEFMDFMEGDGEVLRFTLETVRDARSCGGSIRNAIRKTGNKCKVINNGVNVYVVKEG